MSYLDLIIIGYLINIVGSIILAIIIYVDSLSYSNSELEIILNFIHSSKHRNYLFLFPYSRILSIIIYFYIKNNSSEVSFSERIILYIKKYY